MIHFINESGNKDLIGKKFMLPDGVRKHLQQTLDNYTGNKTVDGYERLNNVLNMPNGIDYNEMKRIKNFFDNYQGSPESDVFVLNGGFPMKNWVNNTLTTATDAIKSVKQAKKDAGINNAFIRSHTKDRKVKTGKVTKTKVHATDAHKSVKDNRLLRNESVESNQRTIVLSESQVEYLKTRFAELNK